MHDLVVHPTVSVAVLCVSGAASLTRCLSALRVQRDAPPFEVVAVCDAAVGDLRPVGDAFPEARLVTSGNRRTPLALASRALAECTGELILLTKDHCVPSERWVRTMVDAQREGRAAVGGRIEIRPDARAADWAYFFVDFYRYSGSFQAGVARTLSVCNVSYRRSALESIRGVWRDTFVETAVNSALADRYGVLWLEPASEVLFDRPLPLREAIRERYTLGRLFGWSRLATCGRGRRLLLATLAPALPGVLFGRAMGAAMRAPRHRAAFVRGAGPLWLMLLARALGEWLAYLTNRPPRRVPSDLHTHA